MAAPLVYTPVILGCWPIAAPAPLSTCTGLFFLRLGKLLCCYFNIHCYYNLKSSLYPITMSSKYSLSSGGHARAEKCTQKSITLVRKLNCDKTRGGRPSKTMLPSAVNLGESIVRGMRESAEKIKRSIKAKIHFTGYGFMCSQNTSPPTFYINSYGKISLKICSFWIMQGLLALVPGIKCNLIILKMQISKEM